MPSGSQAEGERVVNVNGALRYAARVERAWAEYRARTGQARLVRMRARRDLAAALDPHKPLAQANGHRKTLTGALALLDLLDNTADPYLDDYDPGQTAYLGAGPVYTAFAGGDLYGKEPSGGVACDGCGAVRSLPVLRTGPDGVTRVCATCAGREQGMR